MKVTRVYPKKEIGIKAIELKKVGKKVKDITSFSKALISNLGDSIWTYRTKQAFLFNILKQISPINKDLECANDSIENACRKIMIHFGFKKGKMYIIGDTELAEVKTKELTNTEEFCQFILGYDKAPASEFEKLEALVFDDIKEISELIKWYKTHKCIQSYISDYRIPKTHEERILFDFYNRCKNEREKILEYLLFGLKDRALRKSRHFPSWYGSFYWTTEYLRDRPYDFSRKYSQYLFDCRKIDLVGHRISEIGIRKGEELQEIYYRNRPKFYKQYFQIISVEQHFQNFDFYLPFLPLYNKRDLIFKELVRLFKGKKWISFYALALPQVEGLFSEMCKVVSPEKDLSQKSLQHKVDLIRPFHEMSTHYFDYYQYHIPLQRNKFSHTGYDDDFKVKSYDLLTDLSHLLKVFYELENPLVKVKKLLTRRDQNDFISIEDFSNFFTQMNALKKEQFEEIKIEYEIFEKEFLLQDCSIDYTCDSIIEKLPIQLNRFLEPLNLRMAQFGLVVKFEKLKLNEILKMLKTEKSFNIVSDRFLFDGDLIKELVDFSTFLFGYKKYLPNLRSEIKLKLIKLENEYSLILKNIIEVEKQVNLIKNESDN